MEFKDKHVVVTGGTRGIGRAIALNFARQGARVTAAYLNNETTAAALLGEAAGLAGTIRIIKADVATSVGAMATMDSAADAEGCIDVLVNNAGIIRDGYLAMMPDEDWEAVVRGNLDSLFHCCKWGVRKMIGKHRGTIVNLSSVSALISTPGQANYAASKGAVISFTRSLARELGPMGIRVNAVAPGLIETEMMASLRSDVVDKIVKQTSLGRIGRSEEVAEAVAFLASPRASYITGHCLVVDGNLI